MMKRFFAASISIFLLLTFIFPVFAITSDEAFPESVVDMAGVLTEFECEALSKRISDFRNTYNMDLVIVTVTSTEGKTMQSYADDYYDYGGYGYGFGNDRDGALLLLNFGPDRSIYQSTRGNAISVFTDYGRERIFDRVIPLFSDGDCYGAFDLYLDICNDYAQKAASGNPVDVPAREKGQMPVLLMVFASLTIGFIASFIIVSVMKGKLKSVRHKSEASDYYVDGSLALTTANDRFLYSNISKVRKPEESSNSGGSNVHISSSGASHGGGGRSF